MSAVDTALQMEADAVAFYTECAAKTSHPFGKKMFLSIAEDEQYHIACALQILDGKAIAASASSPKQDIKSVYAQSKDSLMQRVAATSDELEALKIGMKMEKEGAEFYKKAAEEAQTPAEKAFFECLAKDEADHYEIFSETYTFLSDTGNWFLWDEKGIVEG
jgi:rubrerythrin